MDDEIDEMIEALVNDGILVRYVDESGEEFYKVHPSAEEKFALLWHEHVMSARKAISRLFMAGMVDINFSEDGPMHDRVCLMEDAFDEEKVSQLSEEDRAYLKSFIKTFDHK